TSAHYGVAYVFNGSFYANWWANYGVIKRCENFARNIYCDTFYYGNYLFHYEKRVSIISRSSEEIRSANISIYIEFYRNSRHQFICERARRETAFKNSKRRFNICINKSKSVNGVYNATDDVVNEYDNCFYHLVWWASY